MIPTPENEFVLIDAGANVEAKPIHLVQHAIMGAVYSKEVLGYDRPGSDCYATAPRNPRAIPSRRRPIGCVVVWT